MRSLSRSRVIPHVQSPPSEELPDGGGFPSPLPKLKVRESCVHDDELLQKETRTWIEQVLNEICDEDKHISDLLADKDMNLSDILADGEILLAMSKVFQKMLPVEEQKLLEKDSISSSKIAKIFPYDNIDRFLRVCRQWKLKDIVLFISSDVVKKVNILQVCVSLQSLASKFPDFRTHNSTRTGPNDSDHEPGQGSQFVFGTTQQGQEGDRVCGIQYVDDMIEINDPLSNGGSKNCEDADKGEREDLKDENKTVGHQCKPMLKLIAGGIATVAALGLLMWWRIRKKGTTDGAPHKFSLPEPTKIAAPKKHSSRLKQERAGTNKLYPALNLNFC